MVGDYCWGLLFSSSGGGSWSIFAHSGEVRIIHMSSGKILILTHSIGISNISDLNLTGSGRWLITRGGGDIGGRGRRSPAFRSGALEPLDPGETALTAPVAKWVLVMGEVPSPVFESGVLEGLGRGGVTLTPLVTNL